MYNLSDTISKSLKLAWKHKMLWVLALMLGSMGSFNSTGNTGGIPDTADTPDTQYEQLDQYQFEDQRLNSTPNNLVGMVLGDSVQPEEMGNEIGNAINDMGIGTLVLLTISFFIFVVFSIFVSLFTQSWAYGAFIGGIDDAIDDKSYSLNDLGNYGRRSLKEMLRYRLIFIMLGLFMALIIGVAIIYSVVAENFALIGLAVLMILPLLVLAFLLSLGNNFALRFIALKGTRAYDAIKIGLRMFANNVVKVIILGVTNCLVVSAMMLVVFGVFAALLFSLIIPGAFIDFETLNPILLGSIIIFALPAFFALMGLFMVVGSYLTTYKNFTWSIFFKFASQNSDLKIVDAPVVILGGLTDESKQ